MYSSRGNLILAGSSKAWARAGPSSTTEASRATTNAILEARVGHIGNERWRVSPGFEREVLLMRLCCNMIYTRCLRSGSSVNGRGSGTVFPLCPVPTASSAGSWRSGAGRWPGSFPDGIARPSRLSRATAATRPPPSVVIAAMSRPARAEVVRMEEIGLARFAAWRRRACGSARTSFQPMCGILIAWGSVPARSRATSPRSSPRPGRSRRARARESAISCMPTHTPRNGTPSLEARVPRAPRPSPECPQSRLMHGRKSRRPAARCAGRPRRAGPRSLIAVVPGRPAPAALARCEPSEGCLRRNR